MTNLSKIVIVLSTGYNIFDKNTAFFHGIMRVACIIYWNLFVNW